MLIPTIMILSLLPPIGEPGLMPVDRVQSAIPDILRPNEDRSLLLFAPKDVVNRADFGRATAATIMNYKNLIDNWDGEGAAAPHDNATDDALAMLEVIPLGIDAPRPMIMANGDVALYWDRDDVYAEIGFDGSGTFYAYATAPGMEDVHLDDVQLRNDGVDVSFPPEVTEILRWEPLREAA